MDELNESEEELSIHDGQVYISSRLIAMKTGKAHNHVLGQIDRVFSKPVIASRLKEGDYNIITSEYITKDKRTVRELLLNRKAFTYYCINMRGSEEFKIAYIDHFEEMEAVITKPIITMSKICLFILLLISIASYIVCIVRYVALP